VHTSATGEVTQEEWTTLQEQFQNVRIGVFGDMSAPAVYLRGFGFKTDLLSWENIASLNPANQDPADFAIAQVQTDGWGHLVLGWDGLPGRRYSVYSSKDMATWRLAAENIPSETSGITSWIDCEATLTRAEPGKRFYRAEDTLTAERYPLVYFCGSEQYVRTVNQEGDVIDSLKEYLGGGGIMLVVPQGPWPFYYDETGQTNIASAELGLPIRGVFESPPAGTELQFLVNQGALPHLPAVVKFPASGDLRFRRISDIGPAEGDNYVPLFQAVDTDGNSYGDGGAYIEHNASEPKGARVLYVWFRIPDVVDPDDLFHDLLAFLGAKL
jgi:hypothetical protein